MYINYDKEMNNRSPKFGIGDHVRISKYKNIFAKCYIPNYSKQNFVIKKFKNAVPWTYVINDLKGQEMLERFTRKNCKKQIKKSL